MTTGNKYWNGSNGKIWVNDTMWDDVSSFQAKVEMTFEEVPNGLKTAQVLMGYKISGSIKMRKTDSKILKLVADDYKNGIITDIKIVGKAMNLSTGKVERIAYTGVTFDEIQLNQFEEKKIVENEINFKAEDFEILQTA
ncbi:phage tail tube protein [Anaerovorax odorimutans]|uniref:phage tail tube protein n=1 Tax=Anaerovorax odorimutans TaxID=109327 RepID=UPI000400B4A5|nr:phage tail tube protein [Anaerovorax odorimutans]